MNESAVCTGFPPVQLRCPLGIIADDLTGALDATGPFAHRGWPTAVVLKAAAADIIIAGHIRSADFVTRDMPLEDVAFTLALRRDQRVIKAGIIRPQ